MFCRECGAELFEGQRFCKVCGTPVDREQIPQATIPTNRPVGEDVTPDETSPEVVPPIAMASAQVAVEQAREAASVMDAATTLPQSAVRAPVMGERVAAVGGAPTASTLAKGAAAASRLSLLIPVAVVGTAAVVGAVIFFKPDEPELPAPVPQEQVIPDEEPEPTPKPEPAPEPEPEPEPEPANDAQVAAVQEFVDAWYGDWEFVDGALDTDGRSISERTLPLVAPGSEAYQIFSDDSSFSMMGGREGFIRDAATHPIDVSVEPAGSSTYKVDVPYLATQAYVDQEMYDAMVARVPYPVDTWYITLDEGNLVTAVTKDAPSVEEESMAPSPDMPAAYVSVLDAYRSALQSSDAPSDARVNDNAWNEVNWGEDRTMFCYALYDLDGDGTEELLIGTANGSTTVPASNGTLMKVDYRIFDMYCMEGTGAVRVLPQSDMGSLGYRAYCVPCKDGNVMTGGSGGATSHVWSFYTLVKSGNGPLVLMPYAHIEQEMDTYTVIYSDVDTHVVTGSEADEDFAKLGEVYEPIEGFDWVGLYD